MKGEKDEKSSLKCERDKWGDNGKKGIRGKSTIKGWGVYTETNSCQNAPPIGKNYGSQKKISFKGEEDNWKKG